MASSPPIASIAAERFDRLELERASLVAKLADVDRRMSAFCKAYSDANGYRIRMTPDQVRPLLAIVRRDEE